MIQSPGFWHGPTHVDYSQIVLLVKSECVVDGKQMTFASVAQDPTLSALVSHEGVLKVLRQPGALEMVKPPLVSAKPMDKATVATTAGGAAIGAAFGGVPGAIIGAAVVWAADAIKRTLQA